MFFSGEKKKKIATVMIHVVIASFDWAPTMGEELSFLPYLSSLILTFSKFLPSHMNSPH